MDRNLEQKFERIGARVKSEEFPRRRVGGGFSVDVQREGREEIFLLRTTPGAELRVDVIDTRPAERHLLLLVEEKGVKHKFLCGHDEREWFVAAVPERSSAATVQTAMEALKPAEVLEAQARKRVRMKDRKRRKTEAYVRQGEWFFVPEPDLEVDEKLILRNEPISRGTGSKPHTLEYCYRRGGETVYVCSQRPTGVPEAAYQRLLEDLPEARHWSWRIMQRDAQVFVRGRVSHADHKTITLPGWHRVLMNTENESRAMANVAFLD